MPVILPHFLADLRRNNRSCADQCDRLLVFYLSDVHSSEVQSYNMSRIKGKDTKPEEIVRKYLFANGFRYRKNDARLSGKPDIVLPKYKTVIFVNGCFWHKHEGCKYFVWPKQNAEFWKKKIEGNAERDQHNYNLLAGLGWRILIVWECELKRNIVEGTLKRIVQYLQGE